MPIELFSRAKKAWNAFVNNKDPTVLSSYVDGYGYSYRPDRPRFSRGNERSIVNAVYNRIAMDVAAVQIRHVRLDENDRYLETINSDMNECFATEANIDQTGRALIQDIVLSMFDEGVVAVMPVDTDSDPDTHTINKIYTMRTAKIVSWKPRSVKLRAYNDQAGKYEEVEMLKQNVLIIENPLFAIVNEPNSTMQRLIRKLSLLDSIDEQSGSGKLDLIIQLPYTVRSEIRKQQAAERKQMIEEQLAGSKYGIAYIDSTEHITQLNRAVENNLMGQIEYLTNMVYSQLGITAEVLNGTADEKTMLNYNNRTIEPILSAICGEARRKWLSKTARTQRQSIMFFNDPFKLVPVSSIAEIADKFTRNEIMSSNEIRQIVGMKKSDDPNADQLRNKNLNQSAEEVNGSSPVSDEDDSAPSEYDDAIRNLDALDDQLDSLEKNLGGTSLKQSDGVSFDDYENLLFGLVLQHSDDEDSYSETLQHYASKYYDPVKAHEYYESHKQLVGRKSTAGLNDKGKEIAAYIKKTITDQKNQKIEASKKNMNTSIQGYNQNKDDQIQSSKDLSSSKIQSFKDSVERIKNQHTRTMQSKIDSISRHLKSMKNLSDDQKEKLRNEIKQLRATNSAERSSLQNSYNELRTKVQNDHKALSERVRSDTSEAVSAARKAHSDYSAQTREFYDNEYMDELDRLKESGQYNSTRRRR